MKRLHIVIICLICNLTAVFATRQIPDTLIINGEKHLLSTHPLSSYLKNNPTSKFSLRSSSTALIRGYIATFEIIDGELFLLDVRTREYRDRKVVSKSILNDIFPNQGKVKMSWFTGILTCPYELSSRKSTVEVYNKYFLAEVNSGKVIQYRNYNRDEYTDFKQRQFDAFKKIKEYKKQREILLKERPDNDESTTNILLRNYSIICSPILVD